MSGGKHGESGDERASARLLAWILARKGGSTLLLGLLLTGPTGVGAFAYSKLDSPTSAIALVQRDLADIKTLLTRIDTQLVEREKAQSQRDAVQDTRLERVEMRSDRR